MSQPQTTPKQFGPFVVHGRLGHGGMGVVLDARTADGRPIALKLIRPTGDVSRMKMLTARLLREAKILKRLSHPGVVKLIDSGTINGLLYLAMERIEGKPLSTIMKHGALDAEAVMSFGVKIGDTLAHLHEIGIVHRDIKPDNIIINTLGRPILTDFGLSRVSGATAITSHDELVGSLGYIAPEVIEGAAPSPASDQYALGRLLFNLCTGGAPKLPETAPIFDQIAISMQVEWDRFPRFGVFIELRSVIERMVAKHDHQRFPDMYSCIVELHNLVAGANDTTAGFDVSGERTPRAHDALAESATEKQFIIPRLMRSSDSSMPPEPQVISSDGPWEDDTKFNPEVDVEATIGDAERLAFDSAEMMAIAVDLSQPISKPNNDVDTTEDVVSQASDTRDLILRLRERSQLASVLGVREDPAERSSPPADNKSIQIAKLKSRTQHFWRTKLSEPVPAPSTDEIDRIVDAVPATPSEALASWSSIAGDLELPEPGTDPAQQAITAAPAATESAPAAESVSVKILPAVDIPEAAPAKPPTREAGFRPLIPYPVEAAMSDAAFGPTEDALAPPPQVEVRPRSRNTLRAVGVAAFALASISALFVAYSRAPESSEAAPYQLEVTAPPPSSGHATALFEYEGGAPASSSTAKIAEDLRKESASAIARRDLDSAERLLGLCIRTADLPACHYDLGALLAVRKHASARAHYERYLATTPEPSSASATRVRRLLGSASY